MVTNIRWSPPTLDGVHFHSGLYLSTSCLYRWRPSERWSPPSYKKSVRKYRSGCLTIKKAGFTIMQLEQDKYYHLYNRTNNQEKLFKEPKNYLYFLSKFRKRF